MLTMEKDKGVGGGVGVLKVTSFGQKRPKTLRGRLSPQPLIRTRMPTMEDTLPRAGYPPVQEAGGSTNDLST